MEQKNSLDGAFNRSLYWTSGLYALTGFHHYYGSVVYGTPWRAHVVLIGGLIVLVCILLRAGYRHCPARWLLSAYLIIAAVFGLAIGLFEGLYNHLLKDILYSAGLDSRTWRSLFPAPADLIGAEWRVSR